MGFKFKVGQEVVFNVDWLKELEEQGREIKHAGLESLMEWIEKSDNHKVVITDRFKSRGGHNNNSSLYSYKIKGEFVRDGFMVGQKELKLLDNNIRRVKK